MDVCTTCSNAFECTQDANCWCVGLPCLSEVLTDSNCRCQHCVSEMIKGYFLLHPEQAIPYFIKKRDQQQSGSAFEQGIEYYINDVGNWVFTAYYHLKKGYCCTNGCLHCPYGFKKKTNL